MRETYKAEIIESSKQLTAREKIMLKDKNNMISLDKITSEEGEVVITPDFYALIQIHNEKAETADYTQYVIADKDGQKYYTGSESFYNAFIDIYDEIGNEEEYQIKVYRKPSKNRQGKDFITCSLI